MKSQVQYPSQRSFEFHRKDLEQYIAQTRFRKEMYYGLLA